MDASPAIVEIFSGKTTWDRGQLRFFCWNFPFFCEIDRLIDWLIDEVLRSGYCSILFFLSSASDWFKEAAHHNVDHPDSHLLLGNLHMAKGEYGPAQKKYEKVLDNVATKTDTYAMLSLGNIWLETLYQSIPDMEKKKRHAERAFNFYKQVLKLDPTNVYAVNGMGAVLAKTG